MRCIDTIITVDSAVINMWIHKHQNWPYYTWDTEVLASKLADIRHRQGRLIGRMEGLNFKFKRKDGFKGHMNTSKYARMAKCSNDTALRDIQNLKAREIFVHNPGGGRSTSYRLPDEIEASRLS